MATVPMNIKFSNHAASTLSVAASAGDTTLYLEAGDGALFPAISGTQYFYLTLEDATNNTIFEVVKVTARSTDTLTVTRAQDGTVAKAFDIGDKAELRLPNIAITDILARDRVHHVDDYGAKPGGTAADNYTGIAAAIAAALAGTNGTNIVAFSTGTYEVSDTLTIAMNDGDTNSYGISLIGRGSSGDDATIIQVASGKSGFAFTSSAAYGSNGADCSIQVKGFNFIGAGGLATSALVFGSVGGQLDCFGKNTVEDVVSYGFTTHCDVKNTRHLAFTNCTFRGANIGVDPNATNPLAMQVSVETNFSCGDHTFINCEFSTINDSTNTRRVVELVNNANIVSTAGYIAGLKFEGCNFYYGYYSLYAHINTGALTLTGAIQDIFINNCQFDGGGIVNSGVVALYFLNNSLNAGVCVSNWRNIKVNDCYIFNYQNGVVCASNAGNASGGGVQHINVTNNYFYSCINTVARFTSCTGVVFSDNNLRHAGNSGATSYAVLMQATDGLICCDNNHVGDGYSSNLDYLLSVDSSSRNYTCVGNTCQFKNASSRTVLDAYTAIGASTTSLNRAWYMNIGVPTNLEGSLNTSPVGLGYGLYVKQTGSGTGGADGCYLNYFQIDDVIEVSGGKVDGLHVVQNFGTSAAKGGRHAIEATLTMTAATSAANSDRNYAAGAFTAIAATADNGTGGARLGALFGLNSQVKLGASATNWHNVSGLEINTECVAGSSVNIRTGIQIAGRDGAVFGSQNSGGTTAYPYDAAIMISAIAATSEWKAGIMFSAANSYAPMHSSGVYIVSGDNETCAGGIDFSNTTFTSFAFKAKRFIVTDTGNIEIGLIGTTNTPYVDFHSAASTTDYDARIICSGGSGAGAAAQGTLTLTALNVVASQTFSAGQLVATSNIGTHVSGSANLEWNKGSAIGETFLLNQKGGGSGGFVFGEVSVANVITSYLEINSDGLLNFLMPTNGLGASAGTITNAPSVGNPTYWLAVRISGNTRYIPCWS